LFLDRGEDVGGVGCSSAIFVTGHRKSGRPLKIDYKGFFQTGPFDHGQTIRKFGRAAGKSSKIV
jgi:hypothetical protein